MLVLVNQNLVEDDDDDDDENDDENDDEDDDDDDKARTLHPLVELHENDTGFGIN